MIGQGKAAAPAATVQAKSKDSPAAKTAVAAKSRVRLPNYYAVVVDPQQREKIYAIQREYAPKIQELRNKLAALVKDRDAKVAKVLTPEQLKKVEELRDKARAKRSKTRKAKARAKAAAGKTEAAK